MLSNNKTLYAAVKQTLEHLHFEIHAIYEPDGSEIYGDCYCAAVDLFNPGMTFRIYFKVEAEDKIQVEYVERWHFG